MATFYRTVLVSGYILCLFAAGHLPVPSTSNSRPSEDLGLGSSVRPPFPDIVQWPLLLVPVPESTCSGRCSKVMAECFLFRSQKQHGSHGSAGTVGI